MNRVLRLTGDGSHTIYLKDLDEPYHSMHGALQESMHVFINQGLHQISKSPLRIMEVGLGTGLNLLLTFRECEKLGIHTYYHTVEKYPLVPSEFSKLNYESILTGLPEGIMQRIHNAPWDKEIDLGDDFKIYKEKSDFRTMEPKGEFDLIFFDAFAPEKQPELWSKEVFSIIARVANPGAILVTYSSKSDVRRALISCGFNVTKVPGPPGKVEMITAVRI